MKRFKINILFLILTFIFTAFNFAGDYDNVNGGFNFIPTPVEIFIGSMLNSELQIKLPIVRDDEIDSYINQLGNKLVEHCKRRDIEYTFYVVNTSDVNAFSLPGGFIYVYRGLIEMCDNEGELAGVLSHEIGHVVARHSMKLLSKELAMKGGLEGASYAAGDNEKLAKAISAIGGAAVFLSELKFSRNYERQADYLGVETMYEAGYDPECMVDFFKKFKKYFSGGFFGNIPVFLRTHPLTEERIENDLNEIREKGYSGGKKDGEGFRDFKRNIENLPPALKLNLGF